MNRIVKSKRMKSPIRFLPFGRHSFIILLAVSVLLYNGCRGAGDLTVKKIYIKGTTLYVQVADEPHERMRGLQKRKGLFDNWGMLFVYDAEQIVCFWMKDTLIPLDCAFIDSTGTIFDIHEMQPNDTTVYQSTKGARYVLEVNRDWFADNDIAVGDMVEGL